MFDTLLFMHYLLFSMIISPISPISIKEPCKINDELCIEEMVNAVSRDFYRNPDISEKMDPLFIEIQKGTVASLNYTFFNRTVTGQELCRIKKLRFDGEYTNLKFQLQCPTFQQDGKYELDGELLIVPVYGKGDFHMHSGKYLVDFNIDLKRSKGSDGKTFISFKKFNVMHTALEPIEFEFTDLFDGNKELSESIHNFAHENWQALSDVLQEPVMYPVWEKILKNANKYIKTLPIEDFISN